MDYAVFKKSRNIIENGLSCFHSELVKGTAGNPTIVNVNFVGDVLISHCIVQFINAALTGGLSTHRFSLFMGPVYNYAILPGISSYATYQRLGSDGGSVQTSKIMLFNEVLKSGGNLGLYNYSQTTKQVAIVFFKYI
jgi:hypothetical protein